MGKLYVLLGKSSSGKSSIYDIIMDHIRYDKDKLGLNLTNVLEYTTRPIRKNEENGRDHLFVSHDELNKFEEQGKIAAKTSFNTVNGEYTYFIHKDSIDLDSNNNYLLITNLYMYRQLLECYGPERLVGIYIYTSDKNRLLRAIGRESNNQKNNMSEICRRYLADEKDFAYERLEELGVRDKFENSLVYDCAQDIADFIFRKDKTVVYSILINTIDSVKKFNSIANEQPFDIDVISRRYAIDAKSIMGLFSIDISKPVLIEIHTDDEKERENFLRQIEDFLYKETQ